MKKRLHVKILLAALLVMSMVVLAACGKKEEETEAPADENPAAQNGETGNVELDAALAEAVDYKALDYVDLCEYKGVEVDVSASEEELQERIDQILNSNVKYEEIKEGEVKDGDTVNIDYMGVMDGVAFDGGTASGQALTIGSHTFIEGFEEQLVGVKVGETVDINVTFPENYQSTDLAGKPATFTVTINYIQGDEIKQEYNDEFVEEFSDGECKTTEEYNEKLKGEIIQEKKDGKRDTAFMYVLDNSTVKEGYPEFLVKLMRLRIDASYKSMATQYGMTNFEDFVSQYFQTTMEDYNTQIDSMAKQYVEQQLITNAIAEKENLTVTDEEYQKSFNEYMEGNNITSEEEMKQFAIDNYCSKVEDLINESIILDKVLDIVEENAVEVDKPADKADSDKESEDKEDTKDE